MNYEEAGLLLIIPAPANYKLLPTCECSHSIADPHENTRVSGSNIKMVHIEPGDSKARAANSDDQEDDSLGLGLGEGDTNQEERLSTKSSAVEHFPHVGC